MKCRRRHSPYVNHRAFWSDGKASTNCTRTGEELDADGWQIEHVTHHCPVKEADYLRYS